MASPFDFGPAGAARFANNAGRSVTGEALGAMRYPSPFFDIAQMYLPDSFKTMLKWCRYYFLTNPLVNAVCYKMAEYPVTDWIFDTENDPLRKKWEELFNGILNFKKFEVESGLDYNVYGNCFISIHFPFRKMLKCKSCRHLIPVDKQKYSFRDFRFHGTCLECGHSGEFDVLDHYVRSYREIRLIRWNPENITVQHNEVTGETRYYYTIPPTLANDIRMGKRHIIERVPQVFIEALRKQKALLFNKDNIYHMKRPTVAQKDKGWGMPMALPVLKDVFYLQILRKAQEAIAVEHIVPMRVLFPQSASGTADVYCVSMDTLVETRDGPVPAADVEQGDFLKSHSGDWRVVQEIADRPVPIAEKTFEFSVASLTAFPFTVSEGHPILAARKSGKRKGYDGVGEPGWIKAKDLKDGDFVLYPLRRKVWENLHIDLADYVERTCTDRFMYRRLSPERANIYEYLEDNGVPKFGSGERTTLLQEKGWSLEDWNGARQAFQYQEDIDRVPRYMPVTEDLAYLVGLYAAEGYKNGDSASLALNATESDVMIRADRALKAIGLGNPTKVTHKRDGGATYAINDVILGEFLGKVCGRGAVNKKLPRFIMEAPDGVALAALQGLFTGDGCNITTETRRVGLQTVSPALAVGSRQLLLSMGYIPCVQKRTPGEDEVGVEDAYQVNLNGLQAEDLARKFSWEVGSRDRTNSVWSQCGFVRDGYAYLRIRAVTERPVPVVRGFQVGEDKSFCVVGVATHNTTVNMSQWRDKVEQEIIRWRLDNNYIPILPIPVGQQTLGGDGRALMLAQEYRVWAEHIIAGMGVPVEFVYGGMQYCQILDTYVFTDSGMVQLKDLAPTEEGSFHLGDGVKIHTGRSKQSLAATHNTGCKKLAVVKTRLGLNAGPSHDHQYRTLTPDMDMVWKKVKDLSRGDKIAVQSGMNIWPEYSDGRILHEASEASRAWAEKHQEDVAKYPSRTPEGMNASLARVIGYLVAEGTCAHENKLGFSQEDAGVMDDFLDCVNSLFGYRPSRWEGTGVYLAEIGRRPPVLFLKTLGVTGYSHEKKVPDCILRSPKDIVCNFLKAYFEGDGSVSTTSGKQMVSCGSKSEELLKQIQLLLLNLGVVSSRYYDDKREMWQLQVRSEYIDVYAKEVGFVSARKKAEAEARTPTAKTHIGERIPYLKEALDGFRERHFNGRSPWQFEKVEANLDKEEYTVREVAELLDRDVTTIHYHINKGRLCSHRRLPGKSGQFETALIHRDDLRKFLNEYGVGRRKSVPGRDAWGMTYSKLSASDLSTIREKEPDLASRIEAVAEVGYVWDEVLDVELFDFEVPMGDLTVDVDHSYIADGMVTHNSGSNVSMRILENHFLDAKTQRKQLIVDFLIPQVAAFMGWIPVDVHAKKFKMADDLQRSAFYLQLNQAGKLSDKSLLEDTDWDSRKEREQIAVEHKQVLEQQRTQALHQAAIQGESQLTMARYQMRGQKMMMEGDPAMAQQGMPSQPPMPGAGIPGQLSPNAEGQMMGAQMGQMTQAGQVPGMEIPPSGGQPGSVMGPENAGPMPGAESQLGAGQQGAGVDVLMIAEKVVGWLNRLADHEKQEQLTAMRDRNPQLYSLVLQLLNESTGAEQSSAGMPLPEQRAPRRGAEAAML